MNMRPFFLFFFTCLISFPVVAQYNTRSSSPEAMQLFRDARLMAKAGDNEPAKALLLKAIKIDPNFVDGYDVLADTYRDLNRVDSAIFYYKKSLEVYPRGIMAHQNLAAAYQVNQEFDAAINQYRELLRHYPDYPEAFHGIAIVHYNQSQFVEAIKNSEVAVRLYLSTNNALNAADARMLAGQACQKKGFDDKALKYFKASKKHFDDKPYYHYYIGLSYLNLGKKEKAREYMSRAELMGYQIPPYIKSRLAQ